MGGPPIGHRDVGDREERAVILRTDRVPRVAHKVDGDRDDQSGEVETEVEHRGRVFGCQGRAGPWSVRQIGATRKRTGAV